MPSPPIYLLGSSEFSGRLAARLGLGFAFAAHISPGPAAGVLRAYRSQFQPSPAMPGPEAILAISVLVAATDDEAESLAATLDLAWLRITQGRRGPAATLAEAQAHVYTPAEERLRLANRARHVIGSPATVSRALATLADAAGVGEVMALTMAHDHATRVRSFELLAGADVRIAAA